MDTISLTRQFDRIGARVAISEMGAHNATRVRLNIRTDRHGEYFDLTVGTNRDLRVVDARPDMRHLLLLSTLPGRNDSKNRFLCGHDERHWFIASGPDRPGVSGVRTAMEALKPGEVRFEEDRKSIRSRDRLSRRTDAFIRQGEWFFVPRPEMVVDQNLILRNEPIARGGGKPHMIDEVYRTGGEPVYVSTRHPNGITVQEYADLVRKNPTMRQTRWRLMRRGMTVFARGRVRHSDHATVKLDFWHRVFMNTENEAPGAKFVAFLD